MRSRSLPRNTPIGVILTVDEVRFILSLLTQLKADDLISEDARCDALRWMTRLLVDLQACEQDRPRSSVSHLDAG